MVDRQLAVHDVVQRGGRLVSERGVLLRRYELLLRRRFAAHGASGVDDVAHEQSDISGEFMCSVVQGVGFDTLREIDQLEIP